MHVEMAILHAQTPHKCFSVKGWLPLSPCHTGLYWSCSPEADPGATVSTLLVLHLPSFMPHNGHAWQLHALLLGDFQSDISNFMWCRE